MNRKKLVHILSAIVCILIFICIVIGLLFVKDIKNAENKGLIIFLVLFLAFLTTHTVAGELYLQNGFMGWYYHNILGWDSDDVDDE